MAKCCIQDDAAKGRQAEPHDEEHLLAACNVEHGEEEHEAHKRAAEVFFEHSDGERDAPHDEQRSERCSIRQVEAAYAHGKHRKHLAILCEVGRQEDDDAYLGDFARLEAEASDFDPNAAAKNLLANAGKHGHEQQHDAHDHERVFIPCEPIEVADNG